MLSSRFIVFGIAELLVQVYRYDLPKSIRSPHRDGKIRARQRCSITGFHVRQGFPANTENAEVRYLRLDGCMTPHPRLTLFSAGWSSYDIRCS